MPAPDLDPEQLDRYSRHIIMDEIGPEGQAALLDAAVLVVGAGGLGSPVLQYLAAAGVGHLGIVDDDIVERSNLQRQVVHADADVGRPKVESAREFVADRNPDVDVTTHERRVDADTVTDLVADYDLVVDASDNFPTRYLINDACVLADTPVSHGAIYRFEGQVSTFTGGEPCYRCLFPEAPPDGAVPDCATTGVLGALPGTVGTIQATETIKLLTGFGETLAGRLVAYDAADLSFEKVTIRPNPSCPVCGEDPSVTSVRDVEYGGRCAVGD